MKNWDAGGDSKIYSPWSSPMVVVKKPTGAVRLCLDFRKVNAVSRRDAYPLTYKEDIDGRFVGTKYFSELNICPQLILKMLFGKCRWKRARDRKRRLQYLVGDSFSS